MQALDDRFFVFYSREKRAGAFLTKRSTWWNTAKRWTAAISPPFIISPLFLLAKKRQHFLTVGYSDEEDRQQAHDLQNQ